MELKQTVLVFSEAIVTGFLIVLASIVISGMAEDSMIFTVAILTLIVVGWMSSD